jgi:hypothetical protein
MTMKPLAETVPAPGDLARLADTIRAHAPYDGHFDLRLPGVEVVRASRPNQERIHGIVRPALCVVAQGAKTVFLGDEKFSYDASRMLVFSVDMPVSGQVTQASPAEPFLCLKLELDPARIADLMLKVYPNGLPQVQ